MKKILIALFVLISVCLNVSAGEVLDMPYKNIKENSKLKITDTYTWTDKVKRKDSSKFVKKGSLLYKSNEGVSFDTSCSYLFLDNNRLIGYSSSELKFYEFIPTETGIKKHELNFDEVAILFKDFRIILISDFTNTTNVFKFKKTRANEKIIILNDTDIVFDNYVFTTNNAKFDNYLINNAIRITKHGMIQFSKEGENNKYFPWFILLVR